MKRIFTAIIAILAFAGAANAQGDYQMNIITKSGKAIIINGEDLVAVTFAEKPVVMDVAAGADLAEVLAEVAGSSNITLNLAADGEYTFGSAVSILGNLQILGDENAPAKITMSDGLETVGKVTFKNVNVDASALTVPVVKHGASPKVGLNAKGYYETGGLVVENCIFTGLGYQLYSLNKEKCLVKELKVENSILGINGTAKKSIFDLASGGDVESLSINNSTLYANPSAESNGCFYSSQSSKDVTELGGTTQTFSITNSTIYNITHGKTVSSLRRNSKDWQKVIVKNCIVVNSGKKGQFCKGLNAGSNGTVANYDVDNNVFNFDGEVVAEQGPEGAINNSIETLVEFADPDNGDFKQSNVTVGDPRWL